MSAKQISVFLENKPGTLKKMTAALSEAKINIRALSVVDTRDFGIVRMLVNDTFNATSVLNEAGFITSLKKVLIYEIHDEAGSLDSVLEKFEDLNINIEYMYAFAGKNGAYMVFRVAKAEEAEAFLRKNGLHSLSDEDMARV
ncbi:MAG: ACT domain-containing protein [Selenomonadaceae bacterium]|nr:ACT domain-containing protein [Selenomonadaceae bacterium]MBR3722977.1 ACT domain-containing protein [Selenomonadaceae bacterium]